MEIRSEKKNQRPSKLHVTNLLTRTRRGWGGFTDCYRVVCLLKGMFLSRQNMR